MNRQVRAGVSLIAVLSPFATAHGVTQEVRTRDSSGVRIIENPARKDARVRFTLGEKPLLEVGGTELNRADQFEHSQGYLRGVRLSDGGLAVIDVARVHYFDSTGKRLRIVGQLAQGPADFQYLTSICRTRGDTIVVSDSRYNRAYVLDGSGVVVRTIVQHEHGSAPFGFCFDDGSFVLERAVGEITTGQRGITRLRVDGSTPERIGTFVAPRFDMVTQVSLTVVASGRGLYTGDPFTGEIREHDTLGRLRRIIRTADRGDSITVAEAEARMDRTIPLNVVGAERTARMERMRARPYATRWPVMRHFDVGPDGTIWIEDFKKVHPSPDAWTAIDSTGKIVGRLEFPVAPVGSIGLQVISFGSDHVMVRRFDANRNTYLTTYPLIRIGGGGR